MRKQVVAFLSAFIITAIVALSMLVVGVNAAVNPNGVAASNSPTAASASVSTSSELHPGPDRPIAGADWPSTRRAISNTRLLSPATTSS